MRCQLLLFFVFLGIQSFSHGFSKFSRGKPVSRLSMSADGSKTEGIFNLKALPAVVGGLLLFHAPLRAEALSSGSRSGGSSFRSPSSSSTRISSSTRSYGTSTYSSRPYSAYSSPSIVVQPIVPMYSPFAPLFYNPFPFVPFNFNTLLIGFTVFALYNFLQNRAGGSDFSGLNSSGSSYERATVTKLQLALSADWEDRESIMSKLSVIATKYGSIEGRNQLAKLLSEVSLALLRKKSDWHSIAYESKLIKDYSTVETTFQSAAIQERSKFDIESDANSQTGLIRETNKAGRTLAVVTLIVASQGKSASFTEGPIRTFEMAKNCLEGLAADALSNDGDNILGVELLWSPDKSDLSLSERDIVEDYPELLKF